jgi:hypothetical protein
MAAGPAACHPHSKATSHGCQLENTRENIALSLAACVCPSLVVSAAVLFSGFLRQLLQTGSGVKKSTLNQAMVNDKNCSYYRKLK